MNPSTPRLQFHQKVITPCGPGIIQGQQLETGEIIVSHDPHDPAVAEVVKEKFLTGIWVLWRYPRKQLEELN